MHSAHRFLSALCQHQSPLQLLIQAGLLQAAFVVFVGFAPAFRQLPLEVGYPLAGRAQLRAVVPSAGAHFVLQLVDLCQVVAKFVLKAFDLPLQMLNARSLLATLGNQLDTLLTKPTRAGVIAELNCRVLEKEEKSSRYFKM